MYFNYVSVRLSFLENGWRRIDDTSFHLWNVFWGRHLQEREYARLHAFQRVNHFPGSGHLGRKDLLAANLHNAKLRFGAENYDFFPESYILPYDIHKFQRVKHLNQTFVQKPFAGSCGRGISILKYNSETPLPSKPVLLQHYMDNPYLINGKKFDLRLYVLCSSIDPLRIYLFEDGLVRFSTVDYDKDSDDILSHLTNYSLNKFSPNFVQNNLESSQLLAAEERQASGTVMSEDEDGMMDSFDHNAHKWSFKQFLNFMQNRCNGDGGNSSSSGSGSSSVANDTRTTAEREFTRAKFLQKISNVITKTILSTEPQLYSKQKQLLPSGRNNCFELYGFDIMIDEHLEPWLVEVNLMPSLACSSVLDKRVKIAVLSQMFHVLGPVMFSRDPDQYDRQVRNLLEFGRSRDDRVIMDSEDELERSLQTEWRRIYPRDLSHEKNRIYWQGESSDRSPLTSSSSTGNNNNSNSNSNNRTTGNPLSDLFEKQRPNNVLLEDFEREKERNGIQSARSSL